ALRSGFVNWAATPVGRGVRAAAVAVLAVLLAVAGHSVACGRLPPLSVMGFGTLVTARVCWGAAKGRMSVRRLAAVVVGVQAGLHFAFAVTEPAGIANVSVGAAAGGGSSGVTAITHAGDMVSQSAVPGVDLLPGGPAMAIAHLLAAVVLACWLAVGERLLWRAARGAATAARRVARRLLRRHVGSARPRAADLIPPVWWMRRVSRPALLLHVVTRRGPPVFSTCFGSFSG
ncbi:hypothetical protein, partial [Frankia sp. CIT1]|uniref:hypothetical protein n=2 Tax=unclassified Frankia TaxID=2632575 RepID=UPI001EF3F371